MSRTISLICLIALPLGCTRPASPAARSTTTRPQLSRAAGNENATPRELRAMTLEAGKSYEKADLKNTDVSGQVLDQPTDGFLVGASLDGARLSTVKWKAGRRAFYETHLNGTDLSNADVACGDSAFQKASFDDSHMPGATLSGGVSSFQYASFAGANLGHTRFVGGGCSFQLASFESADLQGAVLKASGAAFQLASFRNANLVDATIVCSDIGDFQGAKLDGTRFQHADLSSIKAASLESCSFAPNAPPTYDPATRFPSGFDPVKAGWAIADRL